jgi:hypothetical protein
MDDGQRRALEGSIKKWEAIVDVRGADDLETNCPLCEFNAYSCRDCIACGGDRGCTDTPWGDWYDHHDEEHDSSGSLWVQCDTCLALAKKELEYLKSLRDKYV